MRRLGCSDVFGRKLERLVRELGGLWWCCGFGGAELPAFLNGGWMAEWWATRAMVRSGAGAGRGTEAAPNATAMARACRPDSLIMVVLPLCAASRSARLTQCRRPAYQSYSV